MRWKGTDTWQMIAVLGNKSSSVAVFQGSGRRHGWKHSLKPELTGILVRLSSLLISLLRLSAAPKITNHFQAHKNCDNCFCWELEWRTHVGNLGSAICFHKHEKASSLQSKRMKHIYIYSEKQGQKILWAWGKKRKAATLDQKASRTLFREPTRWAVFLALNSWSVSFGLS